MPSRPLRVSSTPEHTGAPRFLLSRYRCEDHASDYPSRYDRGVSSTQESHACGFVARSRCSVADRPARSPSSSRAALAPPILCRRSRSLTPHHLGARSDRHRSLPGDRASVDSGSVRALFRVPRQHLSCPRRHRCIRGLLRTRGWRVDCGPAPARFDDRPRRDRSKRLDRRLPARAVELDAATRGSELLAGAVPSAHRDPLQGATRAPRAAEAPRHSCPS